MWHRLVLVGPTIAQKERRLLARLDEARLEIFDAITRQAQQARSAGISARIYFERVEVYRCPQPNEAHALYFNEAAFRLYTLIDGADPIDGPLQERPQHAGAMLVLDGRLAVLTQRS